jgi:hypothetical protein
MIPTEDNYTDWVLAGIKDYFRSINYRVRTYSIGQVKERQCPVDRIIAIGNKMVGLQFKRPLGDHLPFKYRTTEHQHVDIKTARWAFYCLPDFVDIRYQEVALYHCRFAPAENSSNVNLSAIRYYRWGAFAEALLSCKEGVLLKDDRTIESVFIQMTDNPRAAFLALNKEAEEAYIVSPHQYESNYENELQ